MALALVIGHDIETRMRGNDADVTAASVVSVLQPLVGDIDLQAPLTGATYNRLQQAVSQTILSGEILRLHIYDRQGTTIYSTEPEEVGRPLADQAALASAFAEKTTGVATGTLRGDGAAGSGPALQIYTPLHSGANQGVTATLEIDQNYVGTASSIATARRWLYFYLGAGLLGLYAVLQLGVWGVTRVLAKDHARLAYLYQTGEHVRSTLDMQEVLAQIVRDSAVIVQGQYSLVCLLERDSSNLVARASYDREKESVALHRREVDEWLLHRVLATGETGIASPWRAKYRRIFGVDLDDDTPMAVVCVPMALRKKVTGIIAVMRRTSAGAFGRGDAQMLEELAGQAAMAVEQANLFAKVRTYASELELSYDATLKALSAALDAKDAVTEGHSERVANLTVAMAKAMNIPQEKLVDVERGALLHDVGKIGVPDAVLRKPRTLTRREWQAMQRHPLLAGLLVSKVGFLEGALPILLYHHEHYDGKGYPFGLAGDRIPLEARIFAVVDAYDAMTSDRPYRKAMAHELAMVEIAANSGTQFDPAVVEIFQQVVQNLPRETEEGEQARETASERGDKAA
ncbi:MAG: HD domain-containing phosphohydrolase [Dehalococcoidia bacterium]